MLRKTRRSSGSTREWTTSHVPKPSTGRRSLALIHRCLPSLGWLFLNRAKVVVLDIVVTDLHTLHYPCKLTSYFPLVEPSGSINAIKFCASPKMA
jgi:hypothetical protein